MHDPFLILSVIFIVLLFSLVAFLVVILLKVWTNHDHSARMITRDLRVQNQTLLNLIIAQDVQTLAGLQSVTSPSSNDKEPHVISEGLDLGEAINYEERLAQQGYSVGDLGNDLESAGWAHAVTKRGTDGDPIAYSVD